MRRWQNASCSHRTMAHWEQLLGFTCQLKEMIWIKDAVEVQKLSPSNTRDIFHSIIQTDRQAHIHTLCNPEMLSTCGYIYKCLVLKGQCGVLLQTIKTYVYSYCHSKHIVSIFEVKQMCWNHCQNICKDVYTATYGCWRRGLELACPCQHSHCEQIADI